MRKRLLHFLATVIFHAPWLTLTGAGVLTLLSLHLAFRNLTISTDIMQFLPDDMEEVLTYSNAQTDFGSFHYVIVVFESRQPGHEAALKELSDRFCDAIYSETGGGERADLIASVFHKLAMAPISALAAQERTVNLMTEKDWAAISARLAPGAIGKTVNRLLVLLQSPSPNRPRDSLFEDPLNIAPVISKRLVHAGGPIDFSLRDGYILSDDGQMLLAVIRPQKPATDLQFSHDLMTFLSKASVAVVRNHADLVKEAGIRPISFIGPHADANVAAGQARLDLTLAAMLSIAGIALLFLLVFRRPSAIPFVILPMIAGLVWTLGVMALFYSHLTTISCSVSAVLVGLSIDFAVHIYNRFVEELRHGASAHDALDKALVYTGEGILTAALTTAVAFYGLTLASSPGFKELGVLGGTGILCCLASVYLTLPPLMVLNARLWAMQPHRAGLASFGLSRLVAVIIGYPRATIVCGVVVTAYLAFHAREAGFSRDWSAFKFHYGEAIEPSKSHPDETTETLKQRVAKKFQLPGSEIAAIVSGDTLQEALRENDRLYENLDAASPEQFPALLSYDSLRSVLPSTYTQELSRARFRSLNIEQLKARVEAAGARAGLKPSVFSPFLDYLARLRKDASEAPYIDFMIEDSPKEFKHIVWQYVTKTVLPPDIAAMGISQGREGESLAFARRGRERFHVITHIYPKAGGWEHGPPQAFLPWVSRGVRDIQFTGDNLLLGAAIGKHLFHNLARSTLVVALAVFLLLIIHFRDVRLAVFAVLPVFCSLIWLLGLMELTGIELNALNAIILPLIIGIGIDDGIHVLQRFFEPGADARDPSKGDIEAAVRHTGRAVVVSSLTAIIGFGSLSLADYDALRQIGYLAILGIGFAMTAALTLLPALLRLAGPRLKLLNVVGRDTGVETSGS